jgi:hypothetical protein
VEADGFSRGGVGDDRVEVVASVEEAAPVVGGYALGDLPRAVLLGFRGTDGGKLAQLRLQRVEVPFESAGELVELVEDELVVETHGDGSGSR